MAYGDLTAADLDLAFTFGRGEAASYRDAAGVLQVAGTDVPRFDHGDDGAARGLLLGPGVELGGGDKLALDPLILPFGFEAGAECTVLHVFAPAVADDADWAIQRRAWYSRNARATIDAVLGQAGHHLALGLVPGFRPNEGGFVRFRGEAWHMAGILDAGNGLLGDGLSRPLIVAGAESV